MSKESSSSFASSDSSTQCDDSSNSTSHTLFEQENDIQEQNGKKNFLITYILKKLKGGFEFITKKNENGKIKRNHIIWFFCISISVVSFISLLIVMGEIVLTVMYIQKYNLQPPTTSVSDDNSNQNENVYCMTLDDIELGTIHSEVPLEILQQKLFNEESFPVVEYKTDSVEESSSWIDTLIVTFWQFFFVFVVPVGCMIGCCCLVPCILYCQHIYQKGQKKRIVVYVPVQAYVPVEVIEDT